MEKLKLNQIKPKIANILNDLSFISVFKRKTVSVDLTRSLKNPAAISKIKDIENIYLIRENIHAFKYEVYAFFSKIIKHQ